MNKLVTLLAVVVLSASTFAQGTIFFNNRTSTGDVPIYAPDGISPVGSLGTVNAQLFLQPSGGGALVPLNPATTFRTTSAAAMFFVNPVDVTVPGYAPGASATVVLRVWWGGDYATTAFRMESLPLTISALGGVNPQTGAIVPTPDLAGLVSFTLAPEPSTIAFGVLGAAALLYRRRK